MRRIAIITGASSGVGQEFVRQLNEGRGGPLDELWIVARSQNRLQGIAELCTRVPARPLALDLTKDDSFSRLQELLATEDVTVEWLVNSAGFGRFGEFSSIGTDANADMVRLNCLAVVNMISLALPYMQSGSRIVNLSSIAGAIPQVMLATYSATKAFVLELSRMLDHELAPCGIRVTAVCPKFMRTRFLNEPGNNKMADGMCKIGFEDVQRVVSKAIGCAIFGQPVCMPAFDMRFAYLASRIMPRPLLFRLEDLLFR